MLISLYYIVRAGLIIFPMWSNHQVATMLSEAIQFFIFLVCLVYFCVSYKDENYLQYIKYVLFL